MTHLIGRMRGKGQAKASSNRPSFDLPKQENLPPEDERQVDRDMEKYNETVGVYQPRRVVITPKVLAFSKVGEETAIATILLHEVTKVYIVAKEESKEDVSDSQVPLDISRPETFSRKGEPVSDAKVFEIRTTTDGRNGGKRFRFRANTIEEANTLLHGNHQYRVQGLKVWIHDAIERHKKLTQYQKSKEAVAKVFWSNPFQLFVALLILANFILNILQNQPVPEPNSDAEKLFEQIDLGFTIVFTVELCINAYGNWARPFFSNGWSMFDLLVVTVSLLALFLSNLPGFNTLRLMRVFRVIRLFGRLKSLKKIVNAIIRSIVPVFNSFVILFLITCIYALIGVAFFRERGLEGERYFGTFAQAILNLFQLTAGNAWLSDFPAYDDNGQLDAGVVAYLVSYIVIVNWTLLQVMVAVLLDNFVTSTALSDAEETNKAREENPIRAVAHSLDPLLEKLVNTFDTEEDLIMRVHGLFEIMDDNGNGSLDEQELLEGLRGLPLDPGLHILSDDVDQILQKSNLTREGIDREEFTRMMLGQCIEYAQRRMTDVIKVFPGDERSVADMGGTKLALTLLNKIMTQDREGDRKLQWMQRCIDAQTRNTEAIMRHLGIVPDPDERPWEESGLVGSGNANGNGGAAAAHTQSLPPETKTFYQLQAPPSAGGATSEIIQEAGGVGSALKTRAQGLADVGEDAGLDAVHGKEGLAAAYQRREPGRNGNGEGPGERGSPPPPRPSVDAAPARPSLQAAAKGYGSPTANLGFTHQQAESGPTTDWGQQPAKAEARGSEELPEEVRAEMERQRGQDGGAADSERRVVMHALLGSEGNNG